MNEKKFYVTTPIYYVNDRPHIGHAYTTILADVLARYWRLTGAPTFFLTGTDEHGQKVSRAAAKGGVTPQQHADAMVVRFQELWEKLEVTNDDFLRTTESRHVRTVQSILQDLHDRGEIYRADYDGWYCVACERFYAERDLDEARCPEAGCGRAVERLTESNWFFRMSAYQEWLVDYIRTHPDFIQPDFRRNETLGFLKKPLNDLCISRPKTRLDWGVELPFDKDYVTYVWFDALVNYVSAVGYPDDMARFHQWWPASCHLIGKDILTTHTVYWPTMLKAIGLPMPETVFAHGWWLVGRDKMSKSAGNVVNPMECIDRYGVDAFRYFLMAEMSLGQDASFAEEAFVRRYNTDLANDLGNMLSRVVKLMRSHCDGRVPEPAELDPADEALSRCAIDAARAMASAVFEMRLDQGPAGLAGVLRETNRYLERTQPWTLAKKGETRRLGTVLYCAAETLRVVSGMLHPVMPGKMTELRRALSLREDQPHYADLCEWGQLTPGQPVEAVRGLFPRIAESTAKSASSVQPSAPPRPETGAGIVTFDDFKKAELKTARIVAAERVEGADKLLRLQVQVGEERRQLVAGIAQRYAPENLPGKNIVIVANLKPAKIRGLLSQGMLLAASDGSGLTLLTTDRECEPGSPVS